MLKRRIHGCFLFTLAASFFLLLTSTGALAASGELYENLEPVEGAKASLAEIDPNADFGVYKRVALLETQVAFRSGWENKQKRTGSRIGIDHGEVEKIKAGVSELFMQVLADVLQADDGYEIVDEEGEDVLILRSAIIDLDISAPESTSSFSSRTYTSETGSATVYIELYDSVSGQILGRAADRQTIRNAGDQFTWSTSASKQSDAERLFRDWAKGLRNFLDSHYRE